MSLIDTWAATGAGAFSFTENALYTVEAWRLFLERLTPDGLFTISRWHDPENLGETGRVISLAVATLLESGIAQPAGLGSLLSERMSLTQRRLIYALPIVVAAAIIAAEMGISTLVSGLITAPMSTKVASSIAMVFPLGLLLGFFFPLGLRMVQAAHAAETPWMWSLNGIFGVLSSALAVLISIYMGIALNFYLGAACYLALLVSVGPMLGAGRTASHA